MHVTWRVLWKVFMILFSLWWEIGHKGTYEESNIKVTDARKKKKTNFLIKSTHRSDSLETIFSHYGHSFSSKNEKYRILLFFFFFAKVACMSAQVLQSCPTLCDPMDCSPPGSSVHGDSPGLPCPPPGDLPDLGIKPGSLVFPALAGGLFIAEPLGKPLSRLVKGKIFVVIREQERDLVGKWRQFTDGGLTQISA